MKKVENALHTKGINIPDTFDYEAFVKEFLVAQTKDYVEKHKLIMIGTPNIDLDDNTKWKTENE